MIPLRALTRLAERQGTWLYTGALAALIGVMAWKAALFLLPTYPTAERILKRFDSVGTSGVQVVVGAASDTLLARRLVGRQDGSSATDLPLRLLPVPSKPSAGADQAVVDLLASLGHEPPVVLTLDEQRRIVRIQKLVVR